MKGIYSLIDEAIAGELDRLLRDEGVAPTCRVGCCHCCRYKILINIAEAHTLARFLRREWSEEQIHDLQTRTRQWHVWEHSLRNRHLSVDMDGTTDLSRDQPSCPLLVGGACSAYAVRPVVCRTHFVTSPPRGCQAAIHPESTGGAPVTLVSFVTASNRYSEAIRSHIEGAGMEFSRTQMLLPDWLAMEMGWDFAPMR
ncbi:MAG: YkgJ family cysteine cluster protein [Thermodesulfobacteriota bacterium]